MNRTDRLLAVVLELRGREWVRAEDLARTFEVSVRTVYRDMLALNEAGVPVVKRVHSPRSNICTPLSCLAQLAVSGCPVCSGKSNSRLPCRTPARSVRKRRWVFQARRAAPRSPPTPICWMCRRARSRSAGLRPVAGSAWYSATVPGR